VFGTHLFRACEKTKLPRKSIGSSQCKDSWPPNLGRRRKSLENLVLSGVAITHPDRVISETGHITKGELAEYYATVASLILPEIARRPLSLLRCPSGIDKQCFFQRNPGRGLGAHIRTFEFKNKGKTYEYLYIEDEKGLLEIVQMGGIELHPWGARVDAIDYPDRMIFDLDPAPEVPFEAVKLAAQDLKQRLARKDWILDPSAREGRDGTSLFHLAVSTDGLP
jgi:bifunctional non-homologous end joining protein LigD